MEKNQKYDWFKCYKCVRCDDVSDRMGPHSIRRIRDNYGMFIVYNEYCKDCIGTGIQPIPYWELKGVSYESWREEARTFS